MFTGERIVVTGGAGFVGSFLVEELLRRGASVCIPLYDGNKGFLASHDDDIEWMEGDLQEMFFCGKLLSKADRLFHFASRRQNVALHRERSGDVASDNIGMTLTLARAVTFHPVPTVFMSSATVPDPLELAALSQAEVVDGYALGKAACEILWLTTARQHGFPLLIPRPVGIYGPRDRFAEDGNVIPSLIVKAESASPAIEVWGSGKAVRSFLYVEDVVRALLALVEADATGVSAIASTESVTVRALAERIRDLAGPGKELRFDASKPEGALKLPSLPCHPSLRDFPWTPLAGGLRQTLDWRQANR